MHAFLLLRIIFGYLEPFAGGIGAGGESFGESRFVLPAKLVMGFFLVAYDAHGTLYSK